MKRLSLQRMLGIKNLFVVRPAPSSKSTRPKFMEMFKRKLSRENCMRKVGIHNFPCAIFLYKVFSIHIPFKMSFSNSCKSKFWMVDFGFLLFFVSFPFAVFYSKTSNCELWMVKLWIPAFLSPHFFQNVLFKQLQEWILDARFSSILRKFSLAVVRKGNFERNNWNYKGLK